MYLFFLYDFRQSYSYFLRKNFIRLFLAIFIWCKCLKIICCGIGM